MSVDTKPYSKIKFKGEDIYPPFEDAEIYIESDSKKSIKCKLRQYQPVELKFEQAKILRFTFNGVIYNDNAAYALVYWVDNVERTAFLLKMEV